jgi:hypothetical protein
MKSDRHPGLASVSSKNLSLGLQLNHTIQFALGDDPQQWFGNTEQLNFLVGPRRNTGQCHLNDPLQTEIRLASVYQITLLLI